MAEDEKNSVSLSSLVGWGQERKNRTIKVPKQSKAKKEEEGGKERGRTGRCS